MTGLFDEVFVFEWVKAPLSMNYRLHPQAHAKLTKQLRDEARRRAEHLPAVDHVTVALTWFVKDARRRDEENVVATLKPLCDGLVDAGLVRDDTAEFMTKRMPRIILDRTHPRFEIRVTEGAPSGCGAPGCESQSSPLGMPISLPSDAPSGEPSQGEHP